MEVHSTSVFLKAICKLKLNQNNLKYEGDNMNQ